MILIRNIDGSTISVMETSPCERVEELMVADHVKLSWKSRTGDVIPAGASIEYEDEDFYLLDDYHPVQNSEAGWTYEPEFQSSVMVLQKVPFFMYTMEGTVTRRETDWTLTSNALTFMQRVALGIYNETGEEYEVSAPQGEYKSLSFSSVDIFSALNSIAGVFELEWWVDKVNKVLHLGKCIIGDTPVTLEVGSNVNVPSVNVNSEGFYNRFYVFGSTRNIVQNYNGANVNNLVNKRLTLNPEDYPDGYYEPTPLTEDDQPLSKILIFDDIYPAATDFVAYDILNATFFSLDDNTQKIQIGTDDEGNPIFDMYTVYYFKLGRKRQDGTYDQFFLNKWNYSDKEERQGGDQPGEEGMLIEGLNPSVHFSSGSLQGREFEVDYKDKAVDITPDDEEGTPIHLDIGYFEIKFIKEGNYVIPDQLSLSPQDDDKAILFNVRMPEDYIDDAYDRLEAKMLQTVEEKYTSDRNQYSFDSNPVAFNTSNPNLKIGTSVLYKNGSYTLETRVTKLVTKLDFPVKQVITVGNSLVKGTIQEIKENVADANKNLDIIAALNSTTRSIADAYSRTQQILLNHFAQWANFFTLDTESWPGHTLIKAGYDGFYSNGPVSAGGVGTGGSGGGGDVSSIYVGTQQYNPDSDGIVHLPPYPETVTWANIQGKPSWIGSSKPSYAYGDGYLTGFGALAAKSSLVEGDIPTIGMSKVSGLPDLIPSQASSSNKLADKAFVNSTIQTATANFRGSWNTWADVPTTATSYPEDYAGSKKPTVNDYLVVADATGYGSSYTGTWRFKYSGNWDTLGKSGWLPEYRVNESPMTAAQIAAINSGITADKVTQYDGYASSKVDKTTKVNGHALSSDVTVTKGDLGLGNVENTKLSTWAGSSNITTLGTVTSGVWHGTAIADSYISSAARWNGKQDAISDLSTIRTRADEGHTAYGWGDWRTRMGTLEGYFDSGSAKKALQLTNSRTIWGRSFNGTANVNGDMSSVGKVSFLNAASGEVGLEIVIHNSVRYLHTSLPFYSDSGVATGGIGEGGDNPSAPVIDYLEIESMSGTSVSLSSFLSRSGFTAEVIDAILTGRTVAVRDTTRGVFYLTSAEGAVGGSWNMVFSQTSFSDDGTVFVQAQANITCFDSEVTISTIA